MLSFQKRCAAFVAAIVALSLVERLGRHTTLAFFPLVASQARHGEHLSPLGGSMKSSVLRVVPLLGTLLLAAAFAYQIPTSGTAWTGTNVTTGNGNTDPATKDTPGGVRVRVTVSGTGTTILARNNNTLQTQNVVTVPALPAATNGLQLLTDLSNCPNGAGILTCANLGNIRVEFQDTAGNPIRVRNPILHWSRFGGSKTVTVNSVARSFLLTSILQLTTPNTQIGTPSSATLAVSSGANNTVRWAFPGTPPTTAGLCSTTTSSAGCGSTPILNSSGGDLFASQLDFAVTGERTNDTVQWNETVNGSPTQSQDGYFLTVSFDEDFGDAPASFDPTTAASHILTDLALGSSLDVENANVSNGGADGASSVTPSPNAVTSGSNNNAGNGDGADEDALSSVPSLNSASTTYSLTVPISGASRAGQVCGWLDFNRNNVFNNPTERVCSSFAVAATSVTLNWTGLSGLTAGNNYLRLRASYDSSGVQNPTGRLNSGEVEDYRVTITPVADLALQKTVAPTPVSTGQSVTYTIRAWNNGPDTVSGAAVTDAVPADISVSSVSCVATGTATCGSNAGSGNTVNFNNVSLPLDTNPTNAQPDGNFVTITVTGTATNAPATNPVVNNAVVNPPSGTADPVLPNNAGSADLNILIGLTGTVWNDGNGSVTQDGAELGTNAGSGSLTVYAVDSSGNVIAKATVGANGAYSLTNLPTNSSFILRLSNDSSVAVGSPAPAPSLPADWVNTGENKNGTTETTTLGEIAVTTTLTSVTDQNFGIERLPNTVNQTPSAQNNPGGTNTVQVPTITYTDPEDNNNTASPASSICIEAPLPGNATLFYNGTPITTTPACFPTYNPALLRVDPLDGDQTVVIKVAAVDAADKKDPTPADITLSFITTDVSVSGTVWRDSDASVTQNGTEPGTDAASSVLTVYAVNSSGVVVAKADVAPNGTYTLNGVPANATVTLRLSNDSSVNVGSAAPAPSLPSGWTNTGENKNGATETATPGEITLSTGTTNLSNQNFGIEQLPVALGGTALSQPNPGGNNSVVVPSSILGGSDPDGTVTKYTITSFPTNVDTVTINGTTYTASSFPSGGVEVTAAPDGSFPTGALSVNPVAGSVTVQIPFTVTDNAGKTGSASTASVPFTGLGLSGTVWRDTDGSANNTFTNIQTGTETGTNAGGLNAILTDSSGTVIASVPVAANGTYAFGNLPPNTNVKVLLSTTPGVVGQTAPPSSLPSGWTNTSPLETPVFSTGTSSSGGRDFGIEQPPVATGSTAPSQPNPTGTNSAVVPSSVFSGTDPDGSVTKYTITSFPSNADSITINGTTYTAGTFPSGGVDVPAAPDGSFPSGALSVDPKDGAVTVAIGFTVTDNAGKVSNTSTASVPFAPISLSGTVWNDANGSANNTFTNIQTGTETGTNAGGLNAVLTDSSGTVLAVVPVSSSGAYSFAAVPPNATLNVTITSTSPLPGSTLTAAPTLPSNWTNTSPLVRPVTTTTSSVTGSDFGLEQLPNTDAKTAPNQFNPTGNTTFQVPSLTGTDPEDGAMGTGETFQIVSLPTGATLTYNGNPVTAGQVIPNYDPALLRVDPDDATTAISFLVAAVDAAGKPDPTPATVTMGFTPVPPPVANPNSAQSLPNLVAGDNNFVVIDLVGNDTASGGATLDPSSIDLDPSTPGQQTTFNDPKGVFELISSGPDAGKVRFTPALGVNTDVVSIPYTINDSFGQTSNPATITVEVNVPAANDDTRTTPFDTPISIDAAANDVTITGRTIDASSIDLDPSTPGQQLSITKPEGVFTLQTSGPNAGQVLFTPTTGFFGTVTTPYTIRDSANIAPSAPATITVIVNPPPPTANDDTATTPVNTPISIPVLGNDVGPGIDPGSVTVPSSGAGAPTKGTVLVDPITGAVQYIPNPGSSGVDTFTYTVCNTAVPMPVCDTATVTVNVTPDAIDDSAITPVNTPVTFPVSSNDVGNIDPATIDLDPSTPGQQTTRTVPQGTFTANPDGTVTFTPATNFSGVVPPLSYTVQDIDGLETAPANLNVTVTPRATNDSATTPVDTPITFPVSGNDVGSIDPATIDFDPATPGVQNSRTVTGQGTFTANPDGTVTFTPAPGFSGVVTAVPYTIQDSSGQIAPAVINVTVAPTATNDSATTPAGTPVTFPVSSNDLGAVIPSSIDLDPGTPGQQTTRTVPQGTFAANPDGTVTFTPAPGFSGPVPPSPYTIQDAAGTTSSPANLNVTVTPRAVDDNRVTPVNTPITFPVSSNDLGSIDPSSIDLDPSTPGQQTTRTVPEGIFTANPDGTVTFVPATDFSGVVPPLPYTVNDTSGQTSSPANINMRVTPVAQNDTAGTPANTPVDILVLSNDTGSLVPSTVDLDPSTPGVQTSVTVPEGTLSVNPSTGVVTFTPNPGFSGVTAPIPYTVSDSSGQPTTATITVSVGVPTPPNAQADTATTPVNTPVTLKPITNDTPGTYAIDPATIDLDPTTPGVQNTLTIPGQGTFTTAPNGDVLFTPAPGFSGVVNPVPYTVSDAFGNSSSPAPITVTVTPTATNDSATAPAAVPTVIPVSSNDAGSLVPSTIDLNPATPGQDTTLTIPGQGTFTANPDGTVTFTSEANFSGPVNPVPYTIADSSGQTANAVITVNVTPRASNDVASTVTNNPVTIPVLGNDAGNLDPATVRVLTPPTNGTLNVNPDGTIRYTPNPGYDGPDSFVYEVCDRTSTPTPQCTTATVDITVSSNPPPVAQDRLEPEVNANVTARLAPLVATDDGAVVTYTVSSLPLASQGVLVLGDPSSGGVPVTASQVLTPAQAAQLYFTPNPNFFGNASFTFTATDNFGAVDATPATVTIPVNALPVTQPDNATTPLGLPVTLAVLGNDNDPDGTLDPSSLDLDPSTSGVQRTLEVPGKGTFSVDPATGVVTFTPLPNFVGDVSIPYTVNDNDGAAATNPSTITVRVLSGTVTGKVFSDLDGDGVQDPNESNLANVPVSITPEGRAPFTVTTDANGEYRALVPPGNVTTNVTDPDNTRLTTNNDPQTVSVSDGQTVNITSVGFQPLEGTVTGRVFEDKNGNGRFDPGEGLANVQVRITDASARVFTVTTNADGVYSQPGVRVGDATVDVVESTLPAKQPGEADWVQTVGTDPSAVNVQPSVTNDAGDDGYNRPRLLLSKESLTASSSIGGSVDWRITVSNAGVVTVRGVTITDTLPVGLAYLEGSSKLDGVAIADPVVDPANPRRVTWTISGRTLQPGQKLTLTLKTIVTPEAKPGRLENVAGASGLAGNVATPVVASAANAVAAVKIDLGVFTNKTVILGRVYVDNNENDNFDAGVDTPVPGARVYLSDGRSAITDAQGRYSLPEVEPGTHVVRLDPLTVPWAPRAVPDDQGARGNRLVRAADSGGISIEDFPLEPFRGEVVKNRSTTVERGPVKLEKSVVRGSSGYGITMTLTLARGVRALTITDPLPEGATRGPVTLVGPDGREIALEVSGDMLRLPDNLAPGTYRLTYTVQSTWSIENIVTDPSIAYAEIPVGLLGQPNATPRAELRSGDGVALKREEGNSEVEQ
jgi:CshA-type fibril repeat protein